MAQALTRVHLPHETPSGANAPEPAEVRRFTFPVVHSSDRLSHTEPALAGMAGEWVVDPAPSPAPSPASSPQPSSGRPEVRLLVRPSVRQMVRPINGVDSDRLGKISLDRYEHVRPDVRGATLAKLCLGTNSLDTVRRVSAERAPAGRQPAPYYALSGVLPFMVQATTLPQARVEADPPRRQTVVQEWVMIEINEPQGEALPGPKQTDAMLERLQHSGMDSFLDFCTKYPDHMHRMRDSQGRPILVALVQAAATQGTGRDQGNAPGGARKFALDFMLDTDASAVAGSGAAAQAGFASQAIEVLLQSENLGAHLRAKCLAGCNALMHCASLGDSGLVQRLLSVSHEYSVEQLRLRAPRGHALMKALLAGHTHTAATLLGNPAWHQIQLAGTAKGGSLLLLLLREGLIQAAQALIEAALAVPPHDQGALIFTLAGKADAHGLRPIDVARAQGRPGLVRFLAPWSPPSQF